MTLNPSNLEGNYGCGRWAWRDDTGKFIPVTLLHGGDHWYSNEWSTAQTNITLIPAPGPGLRIVIFDILVSSGSAGSVLFDEGGGGRFIGRITLSACGGWAQSSAVGIKMNPNRALNLTSTPNPGPLSIFVNYSIW